MQSVSSWDWLCRSHLGSAPWRPHLVSPTRAATCRSSRSLPILAAKTCRMPVQLRLIWDCTVDCSLREDNVWLPAVKPQIAPRQICFWTLLFRCQIIVFKLSGLPFHGYGISGTNLYLCHDFIQFCYSQPFNIPLTFTQLNTLFSTCHSKTLITNFCLIYWNSNSSLKNICLYGWLQYFLQVL